MNGTHLIFCIYINSAIGAYGVNISRRPTVRGGYRAVVILICISNETNELDIVMRMTKLSLSQLCSLQSEITGSLLLTILFEAIDRESGALWAWVQSKCNSFIHFFDRYWDPKTKRFSLYTAFVWKIFPYFSYSR